MRIDTYRGVPFVNREKEEEFFLDWFSDPPQKILWVYGPKSSGKTTIIEYVIEKKLLNENTFWIKYLNLRDRFITSYKNFLESLVVPEDVYEEEVKRKFEFSLKVFKVKREKMEKVKKRELDWGEVFLEEIKDAKSKGLQPILIIDEIQKLRDVYIKNGNGERELLKEFLNFCIRLTKELHISHVVILTSNTVFIEKIYNDAKMKETSRFKKIGHLEKNEVFEWLQIEGFAKEEIELVWEYFGGSISRLLEVIKIKKKKGDLKKFLNHERWLAYTEIDEYLAVFKDEEEKFFKYVAKKIIENGYYSIQGLKEKERRILQKWAEKEILFYDPLELRVTGNSRIYEKAMELLFAKQA